MDRKKTIVAAVMINAGILTALFIAAMTMREEPVENIPANKIVSAKEIGRAGDSKPLFNERVEIPLTPAPLAADLSQAAPLQPVPFALPPASLVQEPESTVAALPQSPVPAVPAPASLLAAAPAVDLSGPASSASDIEVQKGDTLEKLAKLHHTSVDEIIQLNHLPSSFLRVGQRLKIPAVKPRETPKQKTAAPLPLATEQAEYYTMKVGDNPWSIAMKHHIKVDELLKLNGLNEKTARKLKPGDRLRIK
jgi:LysM repeat protein